MCVRGVTAPVGAAGRRPPARRVGSRSEDGKSSEEQSAKHAPCMSLKKNSLSDGDGHAAQGGTERLFQHVLGDVALGDAHLEPGTRELGEQLPLARLGLLRR
eukprot:scaffold12239_cov111-Isochrysis_galbana.AAC.3